MERIAFFGKYCYLCDNTITEDWKYFYGLRQLGCLWLVILLTWTLSRN